MTKRKLFSEQTQEARETRLRTIFEDCYRAIVGDNFEGPLIIVGSRHLQDKTYALQYAIRGDFKGYECTLIVADNADKDKGLVNFESVHWHTKKPEHGTYSFRIGADDRLETPIMY